jgi:hypothetical protein
MSRFIDAPQAVRCTYDITLRDGSKARCGRRATNAAWGLCAQHYKLVDRRDNPSSAYTSTRYADEMPESDFYGEG